MKLRDYILGIPVFIILIYIILSKVFFNSSSAEFHKAEKTWLAFYSYDRTEIGDLSMIHQRGYGVYPAEIIVHSWEIINNSNEPFHGKVNLILNKQDNAIKMYYKFNKLNNEITIPPQTKVKVTLIGYIEPDILLTNRLEKFYDRSLVISLVVHDINEYDQFYWDSQSYYFVKEHFDLSTNQYKPESIDFIKERCNFLKVNYSVRWNIKPKICFEDDIEITTMPKTIHIPYYYDNN